MLMTVYNFNRAKKEQNYKRLKIIKKTLDMYFSISYNLKFTNDEYLEANEEILRKDIKQLKVLNIAFLSLLSFAFIFICSYLKFRN